MSNERTTRDPFLELIEAYALGSLDPEERSSVEAHLATGCADCTKALGEARWVVSQLAYLAPDAQPSDMLRGRLLKAVRSEAAKEAHARVSVRRIPIWMWAGVAAAVLFGLYNAWDAYRTGRVISDTKREIELVTQNNQKLLRELAVAHREAAILTDLNSIKIAMPAEKKGLPQLQATWHAALGIVISGERLPVPAQSRTLQLWLIPKAAGAKPIPSLTVRPDSDGKFHMLVENPPDTQLDTKVLAITEEPEGGSLQPTTTPIWVGAVAGK